MAEQARLKFKVRCPHCQQVFLVNAPVEAPAPPETVAPVAAPLPLPPEPPPVPQPPPKRPARSRFADQPPDALSDDDRPPTAMEEKFREAIVNIILNRKFDLPMLPHVALRVIRLTADRNTGMQEIAKVVLTDQTITAKLIQVANSPVYAAAVEIRNINQALVRLGQNEVRNMMLAISLQTRIFKSRLYGRLAKMYWERSVGVAFAGRVLASALRADKDEAFLCGLMHNLGRMIALTIVEEAQRHVGEEFRPLRRTVLGIVDQYHRDIGELTVDKWSLPPAVAEVIRYYERLEDQISTNRTPAVVALGEVCCRLGGVGAEQAEEVDIAEHLAAKKLQVDGETFQGLHARFMQIFENAKAEFL